QANAGIETLYTGADHFELIENVLGAIDASSHIRANLYLDAELKFVAEKDALGVSAYRDKMNRLLAGRPTRELAHEQIIGRLDEAAKLFRILILKSTLAIPYTSVFLELGCGYWNEEAERRLREAEAMGIAESLL
ncbi:MAG: hypothetical protein ACRD3S_20955, partial [Terracidiphilus sp.]